MSKRVIILKGLPACGKSTWCREMLRKNPGQYKRISKDDLRAMLDDGVWGKANERFILNVRDALILLALRESYSVLVDDTNLHRKHEETIRELVKGQAVVEIKDFTDVPLEECIARDKRRANYVGEDVIRSMYREFLRPPLPALVIDPTLPQAIICDLDGTLALLNGRNPYDAAQCEQDRVNRPVADILRRYEKTLSILLVSGRKELHREQTKRWLAAHDISYSELWMRRTDDNRKDALIKREIYDEQIAGKYSILFVLDDRDQVVDFWRSLGLTCLQVAEGDF